MQGLPVFYPERKKEKDVYIGGVGSLSGKIHFSCVWTG